MFPLSRVDQKPQDVRMRLVADVAGRADEDDIVRRGEV